MNGEPLVEGGVEHRKQRSASALSAVPNSSSPWSIGIRSALPWRHTCAHVAGEVGQRLAWIFARQRVAPLPPIAVRPEHAGRRLRQLIERVDLRAKRRQHDPVAPVALERGSTPARMSDDLPAPDAPSKRDQLASPGARRALSRSISRHLLVAAEIDRGIGLVEGEQSGNGGGAQGSRRAH